MILRSRVFVFFLICFFASAFAQSAKNPQTSEDKQGKKPAGAPAKKPATKTVTPAQTPPPAAGQIDEKVFGAMRWRQVGPFRGGRVLAVTGVPGEPNVFYFGAASGGIWKSTDAGGNWAPIFDGADIASIGSIAVSPSDHNIIYAGTGEACIRGNISYGDGVYKSLDGGRTWKNVGLRDTRHIGAVIVDPRNPNIVFV